MAHVLAKDLRESVLQAAFSGKLSNAKTDDTPIEFTISLIRKIKEELIRDNKIKKEKELLPVSDGEELFEIPIHWKWVRMQSVLDVRDGTHDSPKYVKTGYPFVTSKNLVDGKICFDTCKYIAEEDFLKFNERSRVDDGDILMAMIGSIGKPVLVEGKNCEFSIKNVALIKFLENSNINNKYILLLLSFFETYLKSQSTGGVQQFVSLSYLRNLPIPLPPIEEQARIVAKVDELMEEIDEYEKIENQLVELKKNFPGDMKTAVLQAAMQGKLTKQLETDSDVEKYINSVLSLKNELIKNKEIKKDKTTDEVDNDMPFDIPDNWRWVKFGNIATLRPGKTPPRAETIWWGKPTEVPWVSIADMVSNGIVTKTKEFISNEGYEQKFGGIISPAGTMIMSFKLTIGRMSILGMDALHNEAIISIFPFIDKDKTLQKYLFKVLPYLTQYGNSKNAIKGSTLNADSLCNLYIPLPPIEEQKRIVEKLESILPIIDSLGE
ncbi:MAG: restriction endonuclease subunit S [Bacillota bacterium]|nr:restriction endonuclease subunit S [Bacillota bacterium]